MSKCSLSHCLVNFIWEVKFDSFNIKLLIFQYWIIVIM